MSEQRSNQELGRALGTTMNGNPIYAAMWPAKALDEAGMALKPGDLLSLGRFLAPAPPKPGTTITVRYISLPGNPSVDRAFRVDSTKRSEPTWKFPTPSTLAANAGT